MSYCQSVFGNSSILQVSAKLSTTIDPMVLMIELPTVVENEILAWPAVICPDGLVAS